jgi:hypothetical protein
MTNMKSLAIVYQNNLLEASKRIIIHFNIQITILIEVQTYRYKNEKIETKININELNNPRIKG